MVSIEGVDYSYARPTAGQIKAAGKKFAVRYITAPGAQNKGISQAEYNALHDAGVAVVVVYEGGAGDMKKGRAQGVADAQAAQRNLKGIVGLNDSLPVYFACDWDATPAQQGVINAYLDGAASVLGRDRVGLYAGYYPLKRAKAAGKVTWLWQTYAWSGGQVLDGIHLYQYRNGVKLGNGTVDLCRAYKVEYGQHAPGHTPVVVKPPVETPAKPKPVVVTATAEYNGIYFFKGDASPDVFIYEPVSGTKRHITPAEWTVVKGYGHATALTIPQEQADQIPTAA
jgi:hypothetical protein